MFLKRLALGGLALGMAAGLGACTNGYGYGGGVGYASDGYYGGGYGGYDGFGGYGYGGVGFGGGYYGWNNGFYYPGTGVYVYDRNRRPYRWNGTQQRYWQGRYSNYLRNCQGAACRQDRGQIRSNWQDFRADVRQDRRDYRGDVRDARQDYRQGDINREQYRDQRQDARQDYRQDYRQERQQLNRQNRRDVGPSRSGGSRPSNGGRRGPGN